MPMLAMGGGKQPGCPFSRVEFRCARQALKGADVKAIVASRQREDGRS